MKTRRFIVEIEMPEGDFISSAWLKDLIQADCDVEDAERQKVVVREVQLPQGLDEAAEKFAHFYDMGTADGIAQECFKAGAKWMAEQGVTIKGKVLENNKLYTHIGDNFFDFGEKISVPEEIGPGDVEVQIRKKEE